MLLDLWVYFFRKKAHPDILIVSVLLVSLDLPHLLTIPALQDHRSFVGIASVPLLALLLLLGAACIALGLWGILYSRNGLTHEAAWE